jgi:hypothetical protein
MPSGRALTLAGTGASAAVVIIAVAVLTSATSASTPEKIDAGTHSCTTDGSGFCAGQTHELGTVPVSVVATAKAPITGTTVQTLDTDSFTATSFRVRAFRANGSALTGAAITYSYAAFSGPAPSPTPTASTSASPSPTATTTPPPPAPFPDASNTGTPAGTVLHACATSITAAGAYDACQFTGDVVIRIAGVVITNSRIDGSVSGLNESLAGAIIRDTTIDCHCPSTGSNGTPSAVQYNNFTLTRVNLSDSGHGVAMGSNATVEDSYIHDLGGNNDAHKDGIYVGDGTGGVIRHNNIECNDGDQAGCTAAIGLLNDFGAGHVLSGFTITDNLLNDIGSYCFYGSGGPQKAYGSDHITFTGNHFGRKDHAQCGFYGPVTYFDVNAPGNVWSGNIWEDTGETVPAVY